MGALLDWTARVIFINYIDQVTYNWIHTMIFTQYISTRKLIYVHKHT